MVIVKAGVNPCAFDLIKEFCCAGEVMRSVGDQAVNGELQVRRPKEILEDCRHSPGCATVSRRIFGVGWSVCKFRMIRSSTCKWQPIGVGSESGIGTTSTDGGYRPPEAKSKFRIPAADACVGVARPKHRHQARRIRSVERLLGGEPAKSAAILLAGVFCPKAADLGLFCRAHCAVQRAERFCLVVIVNPFLAVERSGTFAREKLGCTCHSKRHHL